MKRREEAAEVFRRLAAVLAGGGSAAVATVVGVRGSAYRRPGARMLVEPAGATGGGTGSGRGTDAGSGTGAVSAGCLEEDVRLHALECVATGRPRLLHYDTSASDALGLGLGCEGVLDILVRPFGHADAAHVARLAAALEGAGRVAVALRLEDGALAALDGERRPLVPGDAGLEARARAALGAGEGLGAVIDGVFGEVLEPLPTLLVCGAGDDSPPLARLAASVGFRVTVADHRPGTLAADRFPPGVHRVRIHPDDEGAAALAAPGAFVVIKTHAFERDAAWLARLLATDAAYMGLMGPRGRVARLRALAGGDARVFGPVGLDLGAEGAEQIALAVVAELLAVRSGREPRHLRERAAAIHAVA